MDDKENVIGFNGPLLEDEAVKYVNQGPFPKGVVIGLNEDGSGRVKITVFGSPNDLELMWMAEQLRLYALDPDQRDFSVEEEESNE